jgi:hypothetical protein
VHLPEIPANTLTLSGLRVEKRRRSEISDIQAAYFGLSSKPDFEAIVTMRLS